MFCRELKGLILDDDGLETVEYAVMTTLIVAALIVSMVALGSAVESSI
ncbi:MAG: hypothetical protein VCD00_18975 [Candidatus Hydrogenedentota bacterium]